MKKYISLFVGLALLCPLVAGAAEFRHGDTISFGEIVADNMYIAGGTLNIAGTIDGDLYVAGGTINIMGTVTKDVVVAGGTVIISGRVGEDLRAAGGSITLGGPVGGELAVAGGNVNVLQNATIARGAYFGSGTVNMNGSVGRDLKIGGGEITLGPTARVGGNFEYCSQKQANIDPAAGISGATTFHQQQPKQQQQKAKAGWLAFFTFWWLVGVIGMIILSLIVYYVWRKESEEMVGAAFAKPGWELLRGLIIMFIVPIVAVLLMFSVIGFPIAFFVLFAYIALMILAVAVTGIITAALLLKLFRKDPLKLSWWMIAISVLALAIIKFIPIIGWIIAFLIFLASIGVLAKVLYRKLLPER